MRYPFRSVLIVPASLRDTANALASQITGGDPEAESLTFAVALSPTGTAPATHYGCCTVVSDAMLSAMEPVLAAGALPGLLFYRWDAVSETLVSTGSPRANDIIGTASWNGNRSLEDAGLEVIRDALR